MEQDHNARTAIGRRDPLLGEIFDRRFRIEARLAAGGFGAIYRATHIKSGHQLAIKVLHANLTSDPGVVARFRREGAALTRLRDPHTITAYELGETPDGTLYIVMELLRGESLYRRFRARGPLAWQRVVAIARDVCSSLIEAHALGIIHRDLKPTNIHLEPRASGDDFVKVLDFGIAKILQHSELDDSELTYAGQMIGTLDYMSPEQMVGGMCGPASDIYTLGIVMYEMIAGRKPFDDANSAAAALAAVLTTTPRRLSLQAVVPAEVDRIVMRCIERQHTGRFQSAAALAAALDEILASSDDAVTTVDLGHPRSMPTAIKGMRMPAKLPGMPVSATADLDPPAIEATQADPAAPRARIVPAGEGVDPRAGSSTPQPTPPLPKLAPTDPRETTLIGHLVTPRTPAFHQPPINDASQVGPRATPRAPAFHPPPTAAPDGAPHQTPSTNLRDADPPTSSAAFGCPASSVGTAAVFDLPDVVQRDALVRRVALTLGIGIAILVLFLIASS